MLVAVVASIAVWVVFLAGNDDPATGPARSLAPPGADPVLATEEAAVTIVASTPTIAAADALRIEVLERQVATLESALRNMAPPAIAGSRMSRIVVDTDAQFVSASDVGVAVIGADGGYVNIDPDTDEVSEAEAVIGNGARVLRTGTSIWLADFTGNQLVRLDPDENEVLASFPIEGPDGIQKDGPSLIVASALGKFVARVDASDGSVLNRADVGGNPTGVLVTETGRIFASLFDTNELVEINGADFTLLSRFAVGAGPIGLASAEDGIVFVANQAGGTVSRVDTETGEVTEIEVGDGPIELSVAFGSLWVSVSGSGDLVEIDPDSLDLISRTPLGGSPTGLSVGAGSLWVAVADEMVVVRVNAR